LGYDRQEFDPTTRFMLLIRFKFFTVTAFVLLQVQMYGQVKNTIPLWHNEERSIRYQPEGEDFIIVNGKRRFNRALYGNNTGFRVEAGDLPEFALYMPGMGGNLQFGLISTDSSKWLIKAKSIKARYRAGSMLYEINDPLLGEGTLHMIVYASFEHDGLLMKAVLKNTDKQVELFCAFGGATGKRFSRNGDIGADPESSFYLKPEYCRDNAYALDKNSFTLYFGSGKVLSTAEDSEIKDIPQGTDPGKQKKLTGIFPPGAELRIGDATKQHSPAGFLQSGKSITPAIVSKVKINPDQEFYFAIYNPASIEKKTTYADLPAGFAKAGEVRKNMAGRVKLLTPDPYLNTLGSSLAIAADAIWEDPSYLHGAVAWRMRLNAWRGACVADPLGWHDRAKKHFSSYALSQIRSHETGPLAPDTTLHFARHTEKIGTAMFSNGYICRNPSGDFRAHHYDMNLVFIDQLLTHFNWTGDLAFVKEMWPVIKLHLAWEKRNFDSDEDGLYDAYCCIWASDALQYSNGGVTHASAYNYRANAVAAQLAQLIGEDPAPFLAEASKIDQAIQQHLWMKSRGWYAEYKDFLGNKLLHPSAGLWTIYHAIDSNVPNHFQKYQSLRYVDTQIPHIPVRAKGLPEGDYHVVSTTNWQPYTWSINNVALAEVLHTSLAYWQGGRPDEGFKLWKSALLESMYLSACPGGFEQLSFYDAIRGELYRDFADPIGMAGRSLVEGLFGIQPKALHDTLTIRPGFPQAWEYASLTIPDLIFDFKRTNNSDDYLIIPSLPKKMHLIFQVAAGKQLVKSVTVNGESATWRNVKNSIGTPILEITAGNTTRYVIKIEWSGDSLSKPMYSDIQLIGNNLMADFGKSTLLDVYDPQNILANPQLKNNILVTGLKSDIGHKTVFAKIRQGDFEWWSPLDFRIKEQIEIVVPENQKADALRFRLHNYGKKTTGKLIVNPGKKSFTTTITLKDFESKEITVPVLYGITGNNVVRFESDNSRIIEQNVINWEIPLGKKSLVHVDLNMHFNDAVVNIFKNKYLSPRPSSPTLQLPWQGIGNWCYPLIEPNIDDTGLRKVASGKNNFSVPQGISFSTPAEAPENIIFTSLWDNYPDSVEIPLTGQASHIYFLMAGSTNPMQSRFLNGVISVQYTDHSEEILELKNPETWWPIEQDYYTDGFAFRTDSPKPIRVHLKTGLVATDFKDYAGIKGFSNFAIEGGAATILDLPLNPAKKLKSIKLKTIANDVVIGLMGITLIR
jgi:hypothetical protein